MDEWITIRCLIQTGPYGFRLTEFEPRKVWTTWDYLLLVI